MGEISVVAVKSTGATGTLSDATHVQLIEFMKAINHILYSADYHNPNYDLLW